MSEYRSLLELEKAFSRGVVFLQDLSADQIARHQVGRELDTIEVQLKYSRERADHEGFCKSGDPFDDAMATRQQADQHFFNGVALTYDDFADFLPACLESLQSGLNVCFLHACS